MEKKEPVYQKHIFVCTNLRDEGDSCGARGSAEMREYLKAKVKAAGIDKKIRIYKSGCQGNCDVGPNILIFPENIWYKGVHTSDLDFILNQHVFQQKESK